MTGFIKPAEIHAAQKAVANMMDETGRTMDDQEEALQEFMELHPVTKEKEPGSFRKVNGVYVTDEDFAEAEKMDRPIDEADL